MEEMEEMEEMTNNVWVVHISEKRKLHYNIM